MSHDMNNQIKRDNQNRFFYALTGKKVFPNWGEKFSNFQKIILNFEIIFLNFRNYFSKFRNSFSQPSHFGGLEPNWALARAKKGFGPSQITLLLFVLFSVGGVNEAWGQTTDYSGTYYIASDYQTSKTTNRNYNTTTLTNNFYLCPTENWISFGTSGDTNDTWTTGDDKPFLTTYKARNHNDYDITKAKWTIEYYTTVSGTDYYYFKHSSGKYLVLNKQINGMQGNSPENRIRVHLETLTSEQLEVEATRNLALFTITQDGRSIYICPKTQSSVHLTVNSGNGDSLQGSGTNKGYITSGSTTYGMVGTIGIFKGNDDNKYLYLEDYITRPTITFNSNNEIVITAQSGADSPVIKYTTDGSTPSATNGEIYDAPFDPADGVTTIKAVEIVNNEVSNVATYFTPVLFGSQHKYLIQSQNNGWTIDESTTDFHFYMIPGDEESSVLKVNTTSLFRPSMEWYFLNAGIEDGVQYFYAVNNANSKYMCYDTTNKVYMDDFGSGGDKFKFKIVESSTAGSFNLIPYDLRTASGNTNRFLCKPNDGSVVCNANPKAIELNNSSNAWSNWKFIVSSTLDKTAPFSVIDATSSSYYKIANAGHSDYYIVPPSGTATNVTTSNSSTENMKWFFEVAQEANASDWLTYYHIRNAMTGEYLYFTKDANDAGACLEMRNTIASGSEDRYMFTWARTATEGKYYIIPKLLKDAQQNRISTLRRDNGTLKTNLTRQAGDYAWTFEATTYKCETPVLTYDPLTGKISITCGTPDATIYVAHYGSEPSSSDVPELTAENAYSGEFDASPGYYKAVAARSTGGEDVSDAVTSDEIEEFHCVRPVITMTSNQVTITCATPGANIYYIEGTEEFSETAENYGGTLYTEGGFESSGTIIKAIAVKGSDWSTRSAEALYDKIPKPITSLSDIDNMDGVYYIDGSFTASGTIGSATDPFTGELDGGLVEFSISQPLFGYINGATIKNVIISSASVSTNGHAGAIANVANGDSRIYNCGINSGSVKGSNYVGGLVGLLDGSSRVINCYSYANITGGNYVGGIVGYNNVATTATNLKTMVMNCMFYGDITGGTNKAPIYNGEIITNVGENTGVSNFNYFWGGASYVENHDIDTYNCALMAETRYLQRFEFFRHLLNSHRELAAWWATGSTSNKNEMMKWVLKPSQIGTSTPYPILKTPGYYPSVVNVDAENATTQTERNKGGLLGTLSVTIEMGDGAVYTHPGTGDNEAKITTSSLTLNITDKDPDHFNFNYGKVQLPYYNDVGTKNYTGNRVVTGWKITSITTDGSVSSYNSFTTGEDATANANGEITAAPYNFADRHCTEKDLYIKSGRVFNQGAYWDVPEGVTAITIQPYWAKCTYLADAYADVVYNQDMNTAYNVPNVGGGQLYTNGVSTFNGTDQLVYTALTGDNGAITTANLGANASHTVYDYAVVLVGNYHYYGDIEANKPYTITTVDLDGDNEPDYSFMLRFDSRRGLHPARYDFLNLVGLGMAQKSTGGTGTYNFGIFVTKGWFESTNTSLFRVTQFEYEHSNRTETDALILQGGVMEQWVSFSQNGVSHKTPYFHVGGNVWFKEFHRGTHQDKQQNTKHPPISVTGGDFDEFYLTGLYRADFNNYDDNLECYINGGRFGIVAGAAQEGAGDASTHANGNVIWQIQNADIDEFYGGGLNAVHPVEGNITTVIEGGYIKQFCGGPKFGDMNIGKTVKTTATNCKFDTYFGAGYGGNSYSRFTPSNKNNINGDYGESNWNNWLNGNYKQTYVSTYKGVSTTFISQYIPMSNNYQNVARLLIDFVSFSLATTHEVTSKLTGCTINGNFYGGGSLGKVAGPVTSTLDECTVSGNVFGAGFSATMPTVKVMNTGGFIKAPYYDSALGVYMDPTFPATVTYTWQHTDADIENASDDAARTNLTIDKTNHILYTNQNLSHSNLGSVDGSVSLTINGSSDKGSTVYGNVYGGGEQSYVTGTDNTVTVTLRGNTTVNGDVFGGGDHGVVEGNTTVNIEN